MKDKKEVTIQSLLTESLRLRLKSIFYKKAKTDLLNETIKNSNQNEGQLYIKLLEKQKEFDDELTTINAKIVKNKELIKNSSGKKNTSDIDKESAMFFIDNIDKPAEERLRLSEDDKQRLQVIMAKLEPIIADRHVHEAPGFPPEGCLDCSGTCTGRCEGTCSGDCLGPCKGSCGILSKGDFQPFPWPQ
jgi:hypothetical protein